jgi:hypothetical protein
MAKKSEPLQIVDGVWYAVNHGGSPYTEECCDCCLVHLQEWKIESGRLYFRYTVLDKDTRAARKRVGIVEEVKAMIKKRKST